MKQLQCFVTEAVVNSNKQSKTMEIRPIVTVETNVKYHQADMPSNWNAKRFEQAYIETIKNNLDGRYYSSYKYFDVVFQLNPRSGKTRVRFIMDGNRGVDEITAFDFEFDKLGIIDDDTVVTPGMSKREFYDATEENKLTEEVLLALVDRALDNI